MNVGELATLLMEFPPDLKVVVDGYESGFTGQIEMKPIAAARDDDQPWFNGEYLYHRANTKRLPEEPLLRLGRAYD